MPTQVKVAVAGLGNMGSKIIAPLQNAPHTQSVIGFDPDAQARAGAEQKFGIETVACYQQVLADPQVGVVFVVAPNHTHHELTVRALETGKAVMCEKPIATTLDQAREMVELAERLDRFLQIGFELRYSKLYVNTKQRIDSGLIGDVLNTACTYICSEFQGKDSWRNSVSNSGGMFGEKLSHYVDLPRWWIGSPVRDVISACAPNVVPYYQGTRDNYHTICRYENGAVSQLTFMMALAQTIDGDPLQNHIDQLSDDGHELRYLIQGTRGAIETSVFGRRLRRWEFGDSPKQMTSRIVEDLTWDGGQDSDYVHNTTDQALDIVRRVAECRPPMTPARDALQTMRTVFAAELSADTGAFVNVADIDRLAVTHQQMLTTTG